jgi:hypothetical protein
MGSNPFDFTHIPVGTPKGVRVSIKPRWSWKRPFRRRRAPIISGVTYGGVAMSRAIHEENEATPYVYYLGAGIPTNPGSK